MTYATLLPGEEIPDALNDLNDKLIHVLIYFFTALLIFLGYTRFNIKNPVTTKQTWFIILLCTVYGGIIELLQYYVVPNRAGEWLDFIANTAGAILCMLLVKGLARSQA